MEIELGKNENLVKSWDYATAKEKGIFKAKTLCNLTVTDKRIILSNRGKNQNARKEIPVESITAVNSSLSKKRPWGIAVLLSLIGILLGVLLIVSKLTIPAIIVIVAALIAAVLLIILGLKVRLRLDLITDINIAHTDSVSIYANTIVLKKKHSAKPMRVAIDAAVAEEIVSTIGGLLLVK